MIFPDKTCRKASPQQEKVDSLNGPRNFKDLETASSSGFLHLHRHPLRVWSSFGKPCRKTCLARVQVKRVFSKISLRKVNRQHLVQEMCMQEVVQLRTVNLCL